MLKKLLLLLAALIVSMSTALAASVEVNSADQAALEALKGLGPVKSKAIIDERAKGRFKDADDLANRVKGLGPKSVAKLEAEGLTINGSSAPPRGTSAKTAPSTTTTTTTPTAPSAAPPSAKAGKRAAAAPAASGASMPQSGARESKSKKKKKEKTKAASAASGA
ncbi:helix-hairpin-helix domain-containing protein [Trinickia sp. Y13]|uniref:ComEA family DNA-binding protein n=1 Tax=Trinickia sp. Y13 TaxID=2917807 RepID=UPI0024058B8A|nr:helix-hairpin-helix domain-containing protein [Trinickia sp. Y13]MDG0023921.1 helix-hairpin-helix domain-containing protein [Trinickia sp. Y13]